MKYKIVEDPKNLCVKCPVSLKEKVFLPKNSKCQYFFTIGRIGESLWKKVLADLKLKDFIFFDPNNRESPVEYNSFFDPHLKHYFQQKSVVQHLRKNNLITDRNEIICSAEEYNEFRKFINRLKTEGNIQKEKIKNYEETIKHQLQIYYEQLRKREESLKKFQDRYKTDQFISKSLKGKRIKMEEEKRMKFINDLKNYEKRIRKIETLKILKNNEIKERGLYRNLELVKKQIFVLEKRKERREKIKRKIVQRDAALRKRLLVDEEGEQINYIIRCPLKI